VPRNKDDNLMQVMGIVQELTLAVVRVYS
jgi:hypothetical protein